MKCATRTVAAALWLAIVLSPAISGQQPEVPKKRSPTLTVDGPQIPAANAGGQDGNEGSDASGVTNPGSTAEAWTRYSLEDTGASLELPGEPQSFSVPVPEKLQGAVLKNFFYKSSDVLVIISYTMTPKSMDAWSYAAGWMDGLIKQQGITEPTIEPYRDLRARRVPVKVTGKLNGAKVELRGTILFIDQQKEVLIVLAEFKQSNSKARVVATRAVDSVEVDN